jgi:hypothetical protein
VRLHLLAILIAATVSPPTVGAQSDNGRWLMVGVGRRVRFDVTDHVTTRPIYRRDSTISRVVGTVRSISSDTIYLEVDTVARPLAIPRIRINGWVQQSLGPPSRLESAKELSGSLAVFTFVLAASGRPKHERFARSVKNVAAFTGIAFGVGWVIGTVSPYEQWRTAWIPE